MAGERWETIQALFLEALNLPGDQRDAFLREACGQDASLRAEVDGLLSSEERAASQFIRPPEGVRAVTAELPTIGDTPLHRGAPALVTPPPRIPGYEILDVLGEGGMGVVYLAEQAEPIRRRVALKVIRRGLNSHQVVARFKAERQTLGVMNHAHIARVYDAGTAEDGRPYFVMEYVEHGVPITTYCDDQRLSVAARIELFMKVCEAVQHAHHKAVIHRDIKPSNVLVSTEDGAASPKIIDFGIAKALGPTSLGESLMTETGQLVGTPSYMSPEQTDVESVGLDTRTDVYSLGALLYELMVGAAPLDGEVLASQSLFDLIVSIREREPETPSTRVLSLEFATASAAARGVARESLHRQLRGDLDWIIMKALEKDRSRRYSSALELAEDLRRHVRHEPVGARPPSRIYRVSRLLRRYRLLVIAAAVFLCLTLVGLAIEWETQRRDSLSALFEGTASLERSRRLSPQAVALFGEWETARQSTPTWLPVWERDPELELYGNARRLETEGRSAYLTSLQALHRAEDIAPLFASSRERARSALEKLYIQGYREATEYGSVRFSSEFFRGMVEELGVGSYAEELAGEGEVVLFSDPPGAEVFCFRYDTYDATLLPVAFHPQRTLRLPFVQVERVAPGHALLRAGDRIAAVAHAGVPAQPVTTVGSLVRAIHRQVGQTVRLGVVRDGVRVDIDWTPFPADAEDGPFEAGQVVDVYRQFGFLPAGYPLEFLPEYRLGTTAADRGVATRLPRGSYLLVLKREGWAPTRYPLVVPKDAGDVRLRLVDEEQLPPGYVYVPPGPGRYGARSEDLAYEPFRKGEAYVSGFAMAKYEVTFQDYMEFLSAPETRARERLASNQGKVSNPRDVPWRYVRPLVSWDTAELREITQERRAGVTQEVPGVVLEPWYGRYRLLTDADGEYRFADEFAADLELDTPVIGLSFLAALEYAHWLTQRHGARWRFRLPTDFEWERAARGVDLRRYVWGNYPLYARAACKLGSHPSGRDVEAIGLHPLDESVFGIRDLVGSVSEPVLTPFSRWRPATKSRFVRIRGANWDATDERDVHLASRNKVIVDHRLRYLGIRLVAELPAER